MTRILAALAATTLIASALVLSATVAEAHERRAVGPYQLVVGWLSEPAFAGTMNPASLRVTDTRATPPKPVEGLEDTLRAEIFHAGLGTPLKLAFRDIHGQPGSYAADFVPTKEGSYTFRIVGKIETLDIDERFESGPGRFDEVGSLAALQYPERVPVGADLTRRLEDLDRELGSTRAFALVALALAIALPLGALARKRRRS